MRIYQYLAVNGGHKYAPSDLQTMRSKFDASMKTMTPQQLEIACRDMARILSNYKTMAAGGNPQKWVDDLLFAPPPPSANVPCL